MANLFDTHDYIAYPSTIVGMATELRKIIDDYKARKISNVELKEIIIFYAETNPEKLFNGSEYNITIKRKIGKSRLDIIDTLLIGTNKDSNRKEV